MKQETIRLTPQQKAIYDAMPAWSVSAKILNEKTGFAMPSIRRVLGELRTMDLVEHIDKAQWRRKD